MTEDTKQARVKARSTHTELEFALTEEEKKAVTECIQNTGRLRVQLRAVGVTQLPGLGLGADADGVLID